jgi:hypothetical protein
MMSRSLYIVGLFLILLGVMAWLTPMAAAAPPYPNEVVTAGSGQVTPEPTAVPTPTPPEVTNGNDSSILPEGLAAIFASLGLYVVTMFTMALGTEILVDVVKLGIGLKSKPTARKSMEEYKDLLPGSLSSLGASAEAQKQFQRHLESLDQLLQPVMRVEELLAQIHEGYIGEAVQAVLKQVDAGELPTTAEAQAAVKAKMREAMGRLTARLGLSGRVAEPLLARLDQAVDQVAGSDPRQLLASGVLFLQGEVSTIVGEWARQQTQLLAAGSRKAVEQKYQNVLRPQLAGLALEAEELAALDDWFVTYLNRFESQASQQVEVYLSSLNQLLKGVERQRYLIQSPIRKAWRRLRSMRGIGPILKGIEMWWNRLLGRTRDTGEVMIKMHIEDVTEAARVVLELERQHQEDQDSRVQWIRFTSVVVGIFLAYLLHIDSADLLAGLLPTATTNFLGTELMRSGTYSLGLFNLTLDRGITAGIILTGLAASAGSTFWHDQLSRLQTVKKAAEGAYGSIQQISVKAEQER